MSARRILIVEPSRAQRDSTAHMLEQMQYRAVHAAGRSGALDRLGAEPIDAILSSWELTDASGMELVEALAHHEEYRFIPVIIVTSYAALDCVRIALEMGATDFLRKPLERVELEARLGAAIRIRDLHRELRTQASLDPLTNILNRRAFFERFEGELERARRYRHPLSLALLDVDHFKRINDCHGHLMGDRVLSRLSALMRESLRSSDVVARYGGEEFIALLPETGVEAALPLLDRVRESLRAEHFETEAAELEVTLSVGIACSDPGAPLGRQELIAGADEALYRAKENGRDRVELARRGS